MRARIVAAALALMLLCGFAGLTLWLNGPEPPDPELANEDAYWRALEMAEKAGEDAEAAGRRCASDKDGRPQSSDGLGGAPPCPRR
jgi:hypothetical protein